MDNDQFRALGHRLIDWAADYRAGLGARPVAPQGEPGAVRAMLPAAPPTLAEDLGNLPDDLERLVLPHLVHWQHPSYFGWFPSGGMEAGVLGDLVSAVLGVVGLSWQSAPALTEFEEITMDWMRQACGLPAHMRGVIQDSASVSSQVALTCARERASGMAMQRGGLAGDGRALVVYYTQHSHSSVEKAALLAGFGRDNLRLVACTADDAMDPAALAAAIEADIAAGRTPCAIAATCGTTSVLAFDPIAAIAAIARQHGLWLHVDAAMAGAALILPEMRDRFAGVEQADSLVVNAHKWLGVPFDCSLYFTADHRQLEAVMSTNPSYLQSAQDGAVSNYRDWGLPLGRRFRALKLWLVLRDQGIEGIQQRLRRDLANAQWLGEQVLAEPDWCLVRPVRLQTVCLRHEPPGLDAAALDAHTLAWAARVNASGKAWISPSQVDGRWMVRISIGAHATEREHVAAAWDVIRAAAQEKTG